MKVTKLTKLLISFMGGGKIDFPTRHLKEVEINGDGLDGGGGGQEETDEVKIYLDEVATRINSSENYGISYEAALKGFIPKEKYIENPFPEEMMKEATIKGNINNFDYVTIEFKDNDNADVPPKPMLIFITEEQFNYFQKSIIKTSTKDFIISSLMIDDLEQVFGGINLGGKNAVKNQLAIDKEDFKFGIGLGLSSETTEITDYIILDDIDMSYFADRFRYRDGENLILFDENETRKIFDVKINALDDSDPGKFSYLEFGIKSNKFIENTIQIGNKNYKYLKYNSSGNE